MFFQRTFEGLRELSQGQEFTIPMQQPYPLKVPDIERGRDISYHESKSDELIVGYMVPTRALR
jgi:hypothetical protein